MDRLEAELAAMAQRFVGDAELLASFEVEAAEIRGLAGAEDVAYVERRVNCMLKNVHLIPGEDEGERCA